jgi:hypothetical protein
VTLPAYPMPSSHDWNAEDDPAFLFTSTIPSHTLIPNILPTYPDTPQKVPTIKYQHTTESTATPTISRTYQQQQRPTTAGLARVRTHALPQDFRTSVRQSVGGRGTPLRLIAFLGTPVTVWAFWEMSVIKDLTGGI